MAEQSNISGAGTQFADRPARFGSAAGTTMVGGISAVSGTSTAGGTSTSAATSSAVPAMGTTPTRSKPIPFAGVSFVCGLVGLLVANLVLGPLAIVLGAIGLRADRNRRFRAALGILLGAADIAVFLLLAAHSAHSGTHGSLSWNFFSN